MTIPAVTYTRQLPKLFANGRKLAQNYGHYLTQNHASLKTNVLVLSSLILVLSRIGISQASAKKAQGTPDGPFRYREAVRTTIREACGWTLSFLLLRSIEMGVKAALRKVFEINLNPAKEALATETEKLIKKFELEPAGIFKSVKRWASDAWSFIRNKPFEAVELKTGPYYGSSFFHFNEKGNYKSLEGFISLFSGGNKNLSAEQKMRNFYRWFPILVGSIPAVFLSGYALERFNMDHSQKVFDAIAAHKQKRMLARNGGVMPPNMQAKNQASSFTPANSFSGGEHLSTLNNQFSDYIGRIQQEQLQRGFDRSFTR